MIKMKINAYLASWCSQEPDKKRSHNLWRYQQVSQNGCVHNSYIQLSHKTGDSGIYIYTYIYIYIYTRKGHKPPPRNPGIIRSDSIKILGVTVDNRLSFTEHVNTVVTKCNQSLYALRLMRQHGMQQNALQAVFKATSVSKLLYAAPSWWGYITKATLECLEGFIRRARKFGYYSPSDHDVKTLCKSADDCLSKRVLSNPAHVLRPYMPEQCPIFYALRKHTHNYMLPRKDNRNFLNRMLFSDLY